MGSKNGRWSIRAETGPRRREFVCWKSNRMMSVRIAKILLVGALASYAFIVAYDNIVDYGSNYQFVRHVLSMDTTFPDNALIHRAITNERVWSKVLLSSSPGNGRLACS
jgi:hypothetical protein